MLGPHETDMAFRNSKSSDPYSDDWRLLVESVEDYAIFMLDPSGRILNWNRGGEKTTGYAADEITGKQITIFYTDADLEAGKPDTEFSDAARVGRVEDEGIRIRKDGSQFWANTILTALRDADGNLVGFANVTRDLTTRRETEESLRRSEERLRLLVESVEDYAIYMLSLDGRVTTWNSGAQKLKGYAAHEVLGQHYSMFFRPEDVAQGFPTRELEIALKEGRFEEEGLRVRKNGECFWAAITVTPMRDLRGNVLGFAKVTRDLTARKEAEQTARELLREQVARAASEATKQQLR